MLTINSVNDLLNTMTVDIYHHQLQRAVELGKWPTGQALTAEQRSLCLQATIAYEQKFLLRKNIPLTFLQREPHQHCGSHDGTAETEDEQVLQLK